MAIQFVTEDGTGLATATAYVTEAEFVQYWENRGEALTGITSDNQKTAINRATAYIDKRFGERFLGWRENRAQCLEWPRADAIDDDGFLLEDIPKDLKDATCEYALRVHHLTQLAPDPQLPFNQRATRGETTVESAGLSVSKKEKVGPIEESTSQGDFSKLSSALGGSPLIPAYPEADLLIKKLTSSSRDLVRG